MLCCHLDLPGGLAVAAMVPLDNVPSPQMLRVPVQANFLTPPLSVFTKQSVKAVISPL